jgi:WD40 repeat protein
LPFNVTFSPDGTWVVLYSVDGVATSLYGLNDKSEIEVPEEYSPVRFSPDSHWLILQGSQQKMALFDLQNRELLLIPDSHSLLTDFTEDSRWLIGSLPENNGTSILLVGLHEPGKAYTLGGHTDQIRGKYFTPDGQSLLTYGGDGTIRVWDLKDPGRDPVVLRHDASVDHVVLSENGKWLISDTQQGVYIWQWSIEDVRDLACRLAGRNLTEDEWAKYMGAASYEETCEQWPP